MWLVCGQYVVDNEREVVNKWSVKVPAWLVVIFISIFIFYFYSLHNAYYRTLPNCVPMCYRFLVSPVLFKYLEKRGIQVCVLKSPIILLVYVYYCVLENGEG